MKPSAPSVSAKWFRHGQKNFPSVRLMTDIELNAAKARKLDGSIPKSIRDFLIRDNYFKVSKSKVLVAH